MTESSRRGVVVLVGLSVLLVAVAMLGTMVGSTTVRPGAIVDALLGRGSVRDTATVIIQTIRLPRALTAALAGAALGVSGLQMQTVFRNPLADPFVLGISSGASLGVALVVLGTESGAWPPSFAAASGLRGDLLLTAAAIAGAFVVLSLVATAASRIAGHATVLILGLMAGYIASALVVILIGASRPEGLQQWAAWSFGSFSGVVGARLALFAAVVGSGVVVASLMTKQLDGLLLGDGYARSMGMAVGRARLLTICGASMLGAVVTAFCGPIAFLGVAVPHLCRGLLGSADHRLLVPAALLLGASLALVAQVVSVLPLWPGVLPLNAVTALLGAPVVITVLLRRDRRVDA